MAKVPIVIDEVIKSLRSLTYVKQQESRGDYCTSIAIIDLHRAIRRRRTGQGQRVVARDIIPLRRCPLRMSNRRGASATVSTLTK